LLLFFRKEDLALIAHVRAVSPRLADCALTHIGRAPIDTALAVAQHAAYVAALAAAGLKVRWLPAMADAPDGVFVEDAALLLDGHAVMTRPGQAARAAEVAATAAALAPRFAVRHLQSGRLDGGDVLRVGRVLYVGQSARSDAAGAASLADAVRDLGFSVVPVTVTGCLHLKTGATWLGEQEAGCLLVNPAWVDTAAFTGLELLHADTREPWAANTLSAGKTILMAAGNGRTAARAAARGLAVTELDISELQKAEAGLTCMSLVG
jgi:dimethylargininase